LLSLF